MFFLKFFPKLFSKLLFAKERSTNFYKLCLMLMKIIPVHTGNLKLDGGAMFGVVPKILWNKLNPADEDNLCNWAMRCLLVDTGNRVILIDNGIGNKQGEKFKNMYRLNGDDSLTASLASKGYSPDDVTDMVLTHLHFDHCGGGVVKSEDGKNFKTTFKNATYWVSADHLNWALNPNRREKASFLDENILPMVNSGQLQTVSKEGELFSGFEIRFFHGHTEAQMIPFIHSENKTIVYMGDLLPSISHIPLPYIMAYDIRPLVSLEEKEKFLHEAAAENYILFFEHDLTRECCTVAQSQKGIVADRILTLGEALVPGSVSG